mmetsp:Transcript_38333/g.105593  ORF Transcript_38333/g.105593 Transcript_38333/m.105593 type:complete len:306 (+) Transcript_38333:97-1014(+)|eukprot:CAMPEP_0117535622 /NCGR_PEP_ID=MMETSP0784-20121206/41029_1 /TAXON_ID=39447 /ORGANISM="" /LENGTH=305 /DNA_ID=CAMNT_0005332153 /DNA_START=93 /DNA_END=1010 /DNA_ORIENTATION=-
MATVAEDRAYDVEDDVPESMSIAGAPGFTKTQLGWRNWLNALAYVLNFAVTYLSLTGIFGATNTVLSKKYQTLVTPAGWAFSIWGPIFIGEGVFTVAQMLPRFRGSAMVKAVTPWWLGACGFQVAWTIAFAKEVIPASLMCMLGILGCLLCLSERTDGFRTSCAEYWLLRAPFSLHLGWIIAASAVNASVLADSSLASPETLLGLAVLSYAVVAAIIAIFAIALRSPDPIVCLVAAWAFAGIHAELGDPKNLDDPDRWNPHTWDRVTLGGLRFAALGVSLLALALAVVATTKKALAMWTSEDVHE